MIYFLPNDLPLRIDVVREMKNKIRSVQIFYAQQMQAHGYGKKTFRFETNARGQPKVHRVNGKYPFSHYDNTLGTAVIQELEQAAVDNVNGKIYLTSSYGNIQRLNLNGSDFQPDLIIGLASPEGIVVDAVNRKFYWTQKGSIRRANLKGKKSKISSQG